MFEFESKMALTISFVVNKKRQCAAIMFGYYRIALFAWADICEDRYAAWPEYSEGPLLDLDSYERGYEAPSVVSMRWAASMDSFISAALLEAEGSVWDSGPSGSYNRLKYR